MNVELSLPERPAAVHLLAVLDILVLLLVFFVLITSITQEAGVSVGLAESGYRLRSYGKPVVVTARGGIRPVVYVGQNRVDLDDLAVALRAEADSSGAESMFLRADEMLPVAIERRIIEVGLSEGLNVALVGRQVDQEENPAKEAEQAAPDETAEP